MATTSKLNDKEYSKILQDADFEPASFEKIADALTNHGIKEMYHALVNEDDISSSSPSQTLKYFESAGVIKLHLMDHPAMNIFMHSCNTLRGHIEQQRIE